MIGRIATVIAIAGLWGAVSTNALASIEWTLNYEFSQAATPLGTLKATLTDLGSGQVELKLESNLQGTEFVQNGWYFNVANGHVGELNFERTAYSGTFYNDDGTILNQATISKGLNAFKADGDGSYDIMFKFDNDNNQPNKRFGAGDSVTYKITSGYALDVLDISDFVQESEPKGDRGIFYTAAHVGGIVDTGDGTSGWIAVPEPSTYIAGGLLLIPLLVQLRRWKRSV